VSTALEQTSHESFRDELNFAEFPLASVSTSLPKDQKTLEFTDEIFDKARNQRITRKLTITASDKYGLPTAMDDEVILGLIQLTGRSGFADRRVYFTRYELLKLLNWTDDTRNYKRLEQSLNRWLGVTLYYDKSWWSKE
jgi:plasmid replication initiation protein